MLPPMAHYLFQLSYTPEAWAALLANPHDRTKTVDAAVHKLGGRIERAWFAFGDHDVVGVMEMPDDVSAAAFAMAVAAGGACRNLKTTPLLTFAEGIQSMKKAAECGYKPVHRASTGS